MIGILKVLVLIAFGFSVLFGCSGKDFLRVETRNDVKEEMIVQKDPMADIKVEPTVVQSQKKDNIVVEISYLRKMTNSDYACIRRQSDPLNPMLLFAFRIVNNSDEVRYYTPVFIFKGVKSLDLADKSPCKFFETYGAVNYLLAKPGYQFALACGEASTEKSGIVQGMDGRAVTLYPDVPVHGILIVSEEQLDQATIDDKVGMKSVVKGWAAFFEKSESARKPTSFRFDYEFTRKDWKEDVQYKKSTPYTYRVKINQNKTYVPLLGDLKGNTEEERIDASENYGNPSLERIGPVSKSAQ